MGKSKISRKEKKRQGRQPPAHGTLHPAEEGAEAAGRWPGRMSRAARKAEKQLQAREKARREAEFQARLTRSKEEAEKNQAALQAQEQALRERQPALTAELGGEDEQAPPAGLLQRLRGGIAKTRESFTSGLGRIVLGKK